ncbi:MAG: hypothetical protein ABUT20_20010 [Bacteroidota bacterium]
MNRLQTNSIALQLSVSQALLIVLTGLTGIFTPGFYAQESANWQAQSIGQDIIDCFLIVPVLVISAIYLKRKSENAFAVWGGINFYLSYTYAIFCFDVHFNMFFIVYCIILGMSFYSCLIFFYRMLKAGGKAVQPSGFNFIKLTAFYFICIAVLFYILWLSEIVPSVIHREVPSVLKETRLFTNPVHVIDLSIFLPGLIISGILLFKRKAPGYQLAPALLTFLVLMNITIGFLMLFMYYKGVEANPVLALFMGVLAIFSFFLLRLFLKNTEIKPTSPID